MPKLTKSHVDRLPVEARDYFAWDGELPGFGVRVWPTGRKVYMAQYRAGGRTRRVKIGTHGAVTAEQARTQAKIVLGDVARGEDPAEDKATRRKSLTVRDLCDNYLKAAEGGLIMGKRQLPKKETTLVSDRGRIERHIKPLLGNKLVRDLVQADVNRFIRDVTLGKTAAVVKTDKKRGKSVVEGGAGTAARTAGLLGGILTYAVSEGIIPFNPARGAKRQADASRTRRLSPDEYQRLGAALRTADELAEPEQGITGIWLLALTGCRISEIVGLKYDEIDLAGSCLRLADSKEGASVRPLGAAAADVIRSVANLRRSPYLLPADRSDDGSYGGMARAIDRVMTRAKLAGVTAHTLRHSFASVAGDLGFTESTIAALIGHSASGSVTGRYIHHLDTVLIAAADKVSRSILGQMTGNAPMDQNHLSTVVV
ncbi:integrase [Rhodopseudomonas rhenobacensis]|uniref:Integrase n=1 Tax=Rhodopseudomonas rhenobacensis TaxID=87461 RepID=A0A7W8DYR2_9BRAD|nr:site-specific integrase [Rhodopseudomonas rhenobacensis]MBB5046146.1 integrase [Rhodopseudomonas rhenobacensis]